MNSLPDRPVALYCRVSTEDQAERDTIQAQVDFLRSYCQLYGLTIASEYLDEGISGTVPLNQRPEGRRLLADARDGRFGAVLIYRTDRLARRLTVLLEAYEELERAGVALRSATEPLDTSTPVGKFIFQLLGSLAELERATITERMVLGRDRVARSGKWTTGITPYGYELNEERHLVPSQRPTPLGTEAEVVRCVFEAIASGSTMTAEARRLNAAGVPSVTRYTSGLERTNPRGWQVPRMSNILHEPGYASGVFRLQSRFGTIEIHAEPLVDPETWRRAVARLERNRALATKNAKRFYALRGLIVCGVCGRAYVGKPNKKPHQQHYWYYVCSGRFAASDVRPEHRCRAPAIRGDWLDQVVWNDIRQFILDPGPALADAQRQVRERLSKTAELEAERQRLIKRLAELDRGRDNVLELVRRGRVTLEEAEAQLDAVAAERAQLQAELDALRAQADLASAIEAQVAEAATLLAKLRERLDEVEAGGWKAKRPWIERLVSKITVEWDPTIPRRKWRHPTVVIDYVFGEPAHRVVNAAVSSNNLYAELTTPRRSRSRP